MDNQIKIGDTVIFTDAAKQAMPISTDGKKRIVGDINDDKAFLEGYGSIHVEWLQVVEHRAPIHDMKKPDNN